MTGQQHGAPTEWDRPRQKKFNMWWL